jgi:putative endonuclease
LAKGIALTTESGINRRTYFVYIVTNQPNGTLYTGMTNDLVRRIREHKEKQIKGFTQKYETSRLVHYESFNEVKNAIQREKQIKEWRRDWKKALIEKDNPEWCDLYDLLI